MTCMANIDHSLVLILYSSMSKIVLVVILSSKGAFTTYLVICNYV